MFADEPLPADSPFWDLPNVIVSPHSSANAASENRKITDIFRHNLRCYLDGRLDDMRNIFQEREDVLAQWRFATRGSTGLPRLNDPTRHHLRQLSQRISGQQLPRYPFR